MKSLARAWHAWWTPAALFACGAVLALGGRAVNAQECIDLRSGGELGFEGSGTPNHVAMVEDVVCAGADDDWSFSTVGGVPLTEHIGVLISELEGAVQARIELPSGGEVSLDPGVPYRTVHEYNTDEPPLPAVEYHVLVSEAGDGRATYRADVCRGIAPCQFGEPGQPPGAPGTLSPPDFPPATPFICPTLEPLSPPALPDALSPPEIGCLSLPATGQPQSGSPTGVRIAVLAGAAAAWLALVAGLAFAHRRDS